MSDDETGESELLTPKEMQLWMMQEIRDSAKAHELRVQNASAIATAYALGELTPHQAHERFLNHSHRWGEALPGTHVFKDSTDEQILACIDRTANEREGISPAPTHGRTSHERTGRPERKLGDFSR